MTEDWLYILSFIDVDLLCSKNYWLAVLDILHDNLVLGIIILAWLQLCLGLCLLYVDYRDNSNYYHSAVNSVLHELLLVVLPVSILCLLCVPITYQMYSADQELYDNMVYAYNVHIVARQWYWSYVVTGFDSEIMAFMLYDNLTENIADHGAISGELTNFIVTADTWLRQPH